MSQKAMLLAPPFQATKPTTLTWPALVGLCSLPTLLNYCACQVAIPYLDRQQTMPIEVAYFLSVGLLVLIPMFCWAIYLSGRDTGTFRWQALLNRMRIKRLSRTDLIWTVAAFIALSAGSFLIAKVLMPMLGGSATPFFFRDMPLQSHHFWILYVWPFYFFLNIFAEEFWWRGYLQPRLELLAGKWAWLAQGFFWAGWHLPMGLDLVLTAVPIFFILPAVVQLRQNTAISMVVHAVFGGFGFLALALGVVQ